MGNKIDGSQGHKVTKSQVSNTETRAIKQISKVVLFLAWMSLLCCNHHLSALYAQEEVAEVKASGVSSEKEIADNASAGEKRISLDLKGVDITEFFRILSLKMGLTIVPSRGVTGRVNVFLNNLTFEDTLDVILISQNLAAERKGNVINVMTAAEYEALYGEKYNEKRKFKSLKLVYAAPSSVFKARGGVKSNIGKIIADEASGTILLIDIPEKLELMEQVIKDLDRPLNTEIFDIKYAKPEDIKTHLTDAITTGTGELYVDERSSKVMVSDLPEKMRKLNRMIKELDEESKQVFIEAEILEIELKKEFQRGVDWEQVFTNSWMHGLNYAGTFPVNPSFTPSVSLASSNLQMSVGTLSDDNYTAALDLLETFGTTKILSRPRIAAVNNEEAKIMVGTREAYVTQTLSQAEATTVTSESIEFIDVGVKLNVVPSINEEGFIMMKIKPEVSSVLRTLTTQAGSTVPIVKTSEAETMVKVKDGSIIMIAGLMKEEKRDDTSGIPVLSRIPFLGSLFGSRANMNVKTELVVFLRPRIISGEFASGDTEPEKFIPEDILPEDMKKSIISKKIDDIRVKPGVLLGLEVEPAALPVNKEEGIETEDFQDKLKGIKED